MIAVPTIRLSGNFLLTIYCVFFRPEAHHRLRNPRWFFCHSEARFLAEESPWYLRQENVPQNDKCLYGEMI